MGIVFQRSSKDHMCRVHSCIALAVIVTTCEGPSRLSLGILYAQVPKNSGRRHFRFVVDTNNQQAFPELQSYADSNTRSTWSRKQKDRCIFDCTLLTVRERNCFSLVIGKFWVQRGPCRSVNSDGQELFADLKTSL